MDSESILRRRGVFSLNARQCIGDISFWGSVMSKMLVTRCEHIFFNNAFEYHAYSSLFREVDDSEESPYYEIRSNECNDIEAIELVSKEDLAPRQTGQIGG